MNEENTRQGHSPALRIATLAVLTAVTTVFTFAVRIPIAPTRGYLNLGDVAIYFSAFTFGPFTALIAGGLGTALADIIAGYSQWAPFTLIIHGAQGFLAALVAGKIGNRTFKLSWLLGGLLGTVVMCGGYLAAGTILAGFGNALAELPGNLLQNVAGLLGGIPLAIAVRRAYPPIVDLRW